ncbi:MAG: bacterioferritin [Wolbachia endosymbiont of Meromenopon meropis]|nr:bacterioferritin [Wolbachia endosymbiont of Meromenopon meropis]
MNKDLIVKHLNKLLVNELASVRQYFLHSAILKNGGINKLAKKMRDELNEEFMHVSKLAERVLLLKGIPDFQDTNKISQYDGRFTKDTLQVILKDNLKLEEENLKDYRKAISIAENEEDFVSLMLLEELLQNEEEHCHWIEEQIVLIGLIGIENYLKTQI